MLLAGCNTTDDPPREPKAWLDVCLEAADCGGEFECMCGVCSKRCSEQRDCGGFASSAMCATDVPGTSLCDLTALHPVCEIECNTNGDCRALGARGVCSAGWCRRATADSIVDGSLLECEDQRGLIGDALRPTVDAADRSCAVDSDCRRVTLSNACFGDGCSGEYFSREAAAQITAKLASLEDEFCPAAFKAGCVGFKRISCPLQLSPVCVAGTCQEADHGVR